MTDVSDLAAGWKVRCNAELGAPVGFGLRDYVRRRHDWSAAPVCLCAIGSCSFGGEESGRDYGTPASEQVQLERCCW